MTAKNCNDDDSPSTIHVQTPILDMASAELERMRYNESNGLLKNDPTSTAKIITHFPSSCLTLLKSIPANTKCIDCGDNNPQWATVTYGALLCLNCSGIHRSLGVQISCVRSTTMDNWSHAEVLAMLEGGNEQLQNFFERHHLCKETLIIKEENENEDNNSNSGTSGSDNDNDEGTTKSRRKSSLSPGSITVDNVNTLRYKTKAAQFYRQQMSLHVNKVLNHGEYKGREVSRQLRAGGRDGRRSSTGSKNRNPRHTIDHRNSTAN